MAEKTASELLREQLAYKRKNGRLYSDESIVNAADSYCDGYKAFLDKAKTEREAAKAAMQRRRALPSLSTAKSTALGTGSSLTTAAKRLPLR